VPEAAMMIVGVQNRYALRRITFVRCCRRWRRRTARGKEGK